MLIDEVLSFELQRQMHNLYLSFFDGEISMYTNKPFRTIDEQIQLLKKRKLIFLNEETAKNALSRYGYYEIINGYKDLFLIEKGNDGDCKIVCVRMNDSLN